MPNNGYHQFHRTRKYDDDAMRDICSFILLGGSNKATMAKFKLSKRALCDITSGTTKGSSFAMREAIDRAAREKIWYTQYKRATV